MTGFKLPFLHKTNTFFRYVFGVEILQSKSETIMNKKEICFYVILSKRKKYIILSKMMKI